VTAFILLGPGSCAPLLLAPVLMHHGLIPGEPPPSAVFVLAAQLLVLLPAAIVVTAAAEGSAGVRCLLGRAARWRFGTGWGFRPSCPAPGHRAGWASPRWSRVWRLANQGRTVLISSHLLSELALTADHLVMIGRGRLLADRPMSEVLASGIPEVRVVTPQAPLLARALESPAVTARLTSHDTLLIRGPRPRRSPASPRRTVPRSTSSPPCALR
jgi:hypothetical protein